MMNRNEVSLSHLFLLLVLDELVYSAMVYDIKHRAVSEAHPDM